VGRVRYYFETKDFARGWESRDELPPWVGADELDPDVPAFHYPPQRWDGFDWDRSQREPFLGVSYKPGDWNWGNVQAAAGLCLIVGDKLCFYFTGVEFSGRHLFVNANTTSGDLRVEVLDSKGGIVSPFMIAAGGPGFVWPPRYVEGVGAEMTDPGESGNRH
jgi:hypothetical protein